MIQSLRRPGSCLPLSRPIRTDDVSVLLQDSEPALLPRLFRSHHVISIALAEFAIERSGDSPPWRGRLRRGEISLAPAGPGEQVVWPEGAKQLHVHLHPRMLAGSIRIIPRASDSRIREIAMGLIDAITANHQDEVHGLITSLAEHVGAAYGTEASRPITVGDYPLHAVLDLLRAPGAEPLRIEALARRVGLSRFQLSRRFRRLAGCSPNAWQMASRVERAKHMLTVGGRSISETAYACGFADQSHLTRAFVRWSGTTPARFVALHQRTWLSTH